MEWSHDLFKLFFFFFSKRGKNLLGKNSYTEPEFTPVENMSVVKLLF